MSGLAGEAIGLGTQNVSPIGGGAAVDAESKGSMENFIGFGVGATSYDPSPVDFDSADDTVTSAADGSTRMVPEYIDSQLSWVGANPWVVVPPPVGFTWVPPIEVVRNKNTGAYDTNYDPSPFLTEGDSGVTTYYVDSVTGLDSNPGTELLPKRSLVSVTGGRTNKLLIKARGKFYKSTTGYIQGGNDNLCFEAWGGASCVISTESEAPIVWTDEGGGVWSTPNIPGDVNAAWAIFKGTDVDTMIPYTEAANEAACRATPSTMFRDTTLTKTLCHTTDGTSPAIGHTALGRSGACYEWSGDSFSFPQRIAFYGVSFIGGNTAALVSAGKSALYAKTVSFANCSFKRAYNFGAMKASGAMEITTHQCAAGPSAFDGFSYSTSSGAKDSTPVPNAVEIENVGTLNGYVNTGSNQGSTIHFGGKIVRVNCTYSQNGDNQIADISDNTESWNLGCIFGPTGTPSGDAGARAGSEAGSTKMWLDGCIFVQPLTYDVMCDGSSAFLYYTNMLTPNIDPLSNGTIAPY